MWRCVAAASPASTTANSPHHLFTMLLCHSDVPLTTSSLCRPR